MAEDLVPSPDGEEVDGEVIPEEHPIPDGFVVEWWEEPTRFVRIYRITVPEVVMQAMTEVDMAHFTSGLSAIMEISRKYSP